MPTPTDEAFALRITPVVFAGIFALGCWADPVDLFGFWPGWVTRLTFGAGCLSMLVAAAHPTERFRFVALAFGSWAAMSRGLTILIDGQDLVPRKSEIIGGSVWMATSYMVLFAWLVTVPFVRWRHDNE